MHPIPAPFTGELPYQRRGGEAQPRGPSRAGGRGRRRLLFQELGRGKSGPRPAPRPVHRDTTPTALYQGRGYREAEACLRCEAPSRA